MQWPMKVNSKETFFTKTGNLMSIFEINREACLKIINLRGSIIVSRGKVHELINLSGYFFIHNGNLSGWVFYEIVDNECEIVALDSQFQRLGIGSKLVNEVINKALESQCRRVWLITSNDNLNAMRFYQKRGFEMRQIYYNAITEARLIKPSIPLIGHYGIPIKHEIELEYKIV
jgi:RimJ/RimL family protein N-acetyltransferase